MFGIPFKEEVVYNRNFLNNVIFDATFAVNRKCSANRDDIANEFAAELPIRTDGVSQEIQFSFNAKTKSNSITTRQDEDNRTLILRAKDGQKQLDLTNISMKYQETGAKYKDQKDFDAKVGKGLKFLSQIDVKEFTKISLRKVNIVNFNTSSNGYVETIGYNAVQDLISPKLLCSFESLVDSIPFMKQHMSTIQFEDADNQLIIRYGTIIDSKQENGRSVKGKVIIDFQLSKMSRVSIQEVDQLLSDYHQELYNAFNWCITEHMLQILNGN